MYVVIFGRIVGVCLVCLTWSDSRDVYFDYIQLWLKVSKFQKLIFLTIWTKTPKASKMSQIRKKWSHFIMLVRGEFNTIVRFLVQMRTRKFAFEIYWPSVSSWRMFFYVPTKYGASPFTYVGCNNSPWKRTILTKLFSSIWQHLIHIKMAFWATCKIAQPIQPIWQQIFALPWSALKKPPWEFNFFHIFGIPSSSRHEKRCQMLQTLFWLFQCSKNPWWYKNGTYSSGKVCLLLW